MAHNGSAIGQILAKMDERRETLQALDGELEQLYQETRNLEATLEGIGPDYDLDQVGRDITRLDAVRTVLARLEQARTLEENALARARSEHVILSQRLERAEKALEGLSGMALTEEDRAGREARCRVERHWLAGDPKEDEKYVGIAEAIIAEYEDRQAPEFRSLVGTMREMRAGMVRRRTEDD